MEKSKLAKFMAVGLAAGVDITKIIDSMPKGSTPNRHKPHQGEREMARRRKKMKGTA